jgi:predicted nucleic-acid-binding Zn-ribbon protein
VTLPAYDPGARCPKCGNDGVSTTYKDGKLALPWVLYMVELGEYIGRRCQRCGYTWEEATVDAEGAA